MCARRRGRRDAPNFAPASERVQHDRAERRQADAAGDDDHVRAALLGDRPGRAERAAQAEHAARLGRADRLGHGADGADRLHDAALADPAAADGDRHLADPERVEHHELPGPDDRRLAASRARASASTCRRSRCTRSRTTNGAGTSAPRQARAQAVAVAIDVEQPEPRPLEPLDHHLREALHQLVAERRVVVALSAQAGAVEGRSRAPPTARARRNASGTAGRATTSRPPRRPRSSRSSSPPRLGTCVSSATLPSRTTKKASAGSPSRKSMSPASKRTFGAQPASSASRFVVAARRRTGRSASELVKPRAIGQLLVVARIAATSSVMSMPTGHQVMHRPQPTQPDVPNWSCQVPSLCVIHCR